MSIQRNIILARFQRKSDNSIVIEGKSDTYTINASTAQTLTINGDLLDGLTLDTMLTNSSGREIAISSLISSWNIPDDDIVVSLLHLNNGAEGVFNISSDDYITLPFSLSEPVYFNLGDYVDLNLILDDAQGKQFAKRYEICDFPKPNLNTSTGGYDYELRLDAYYMKWKNKIFRYFATDIEFGEEACGEASWSLTANLETHMAVFLRNLLSLGEQYNGQMFTYGINNMDADPTEAKFISYSDTNLIDALSDIAEAYDCEWWVDDNIITFGKSEHSDYMQIEVGIEAETMSRQDSSGTFATRIYAFGSERNLQSDYRETTDEVLVDGVVQRRLMLPAEVPYIEAWRYESSGERIYTTAYKTDASGNKVYVGDSGFSELDSELHICGYRVVVSKDADGKITLSRSYVTEEYYQSLTRMKVDEVVEGIVQTDDIYPRTNDSVKLVSIYWKKFDASDESDEGEIVFDDIDPIYAGQTFDPNTYPLVGREYLQCYYRIKSTFFGENFDYDYIMQAETLSLVFNSGRLNGMNFEVMFLGAYGDTKAEYTSPDGTQWFELVANQDYGTTLPSTTLYPEEGDSFTLYNWQYINLETGELTPEALEMISNAEYELLAYAIEYVWKTMIDDGIYECQMNPAYVYADGDEQKYVQRTYALGQRIMLVNDALFAIPRESRVIGFTISLDIPYDHPVYKVGESVQYSRIGAVESKVNELTYNGFSYELSGSGSGGSSIYLIKTNDSTSAKDTNAYSALRSNNTFLRKDQNDSTSHNLTVQGILTMVKEALAEGGIQFGDFMSGLLGTGGRIDEDGIGELEALSLRTWLEVPELRKNRVTILAGTSWLAPGNGIIESVEIDVDESTGELADTGTITLKLEEGEEGAISENDLCLGIFSDYDGINENSAENEDEHNGNFQFAGFGTVYFRVVDILEKSDCSKFTYQLREYSTSGSWRQKNHPRPYMTFVAYGNVDNTDRQACVLSSLSYRIRLRNMNTWMYGASNVVYVEGKLDDFNLGGTQLSGEGVYIGNGYFSGAIMQISNAPYIMSVSDTLQWILKTGETDTITCCISKMTQDVTSDFNKWTAKIEGGSELTISSKGVITATYDELFSTSDNVMVDITAQMVDEDTGEVLGEAYGSCVLKAWDESRDGLTIIQSADSVTFNDDNNSYDFSIEVLRGNVHDAITSPTYSGKPDGVDISNVNNDNGVYSFTITRSDTSVNISGKLTITFTVDEVTYTRYLYLLTAVDGEDAYYLYTSVDSVVFNNTDSKYIDVGLYVGGQRIWLQEENVAISSIPSGVTIEYIGTFGYIVDYELRFANYANRTALSSTFTITVTYNGVSLQKAIPVLAVYDGEDGKDAAGIAIDIPMQDIAIKGTCDEDFYCHIYVNNELYPITRSSIKVDDSQISGPFGFGLEDVSSGNICFNYFCMVYGGQYSLDAIIPVTFTINGVDFVRNFHMYTVFDGSASEKGDDAVVYELDCSVSTIHYQAAAGAFAPSEVTCNLYKVTGNYKEEYKDGRIDIDVMYVGSTTWANIYSDTGTSVTFTPNHNNGYPTQYRITATTPQGDIERIINVTNSCAVREQNWDNISEDFDFESGQIGETFYDFVVVNNNGTLFYYQCIKSHTKFEGEEVTNTEYWKQVNSFDAVATNLLLAGTAKIDNLYVDDLFMVQGNTAIWLNALLDGMKINKSTLLEGKTERNDQDANMALWKSPTVEFSAGDLPSVSDVYSDFTSGNFTLSSTSGKYSGSGLANGGQDKGWADVEEDFISSVSLGSIEKDAIIQISNADLARNVVATLTEGAASGTAAGDLEKYKSYITLQLRFSDSSNSAGSYQILAQVTGICSSSAAGVTCDLTFPAFTQYVASPSTGTKYLQLWLGGGAVRCDSSTGNATASVELNGTSNIYSVSALTEQYIARYTGQGLFIGLNSESYIRLALPSADNVQHELRAKGYGINISPNGLMQTTYQISGTLHHVPFGGLLMSAYVRVDSSNVTARLWAWDGYNINMTRTGTGAFSFTIPSSWGTKLRGSSTLNISHFAINVTPYAGGTAGVIASIWSYSESSDGITIQIAIHNSSLAQTDGTVWLTVHYLGDAQQIN